MSKNTLISIIPYEGRCVIEINARIYAESSRKQAWQRQPKETIATNNRSGRTEGNQCI